MNRDLALLDLAERVLRVVFDLPVESKAQDDIRALVESELPEAVKLYEQVKKKTGKKEINIGDFPAALRRLVALFLKTIKRLGDLAKADIDAWKDEFLTWLARYYAAAWMVGHDQPELSDAEIDTIVDQVSVQVDFLKQFAIDVQTAEAFDEGLQQRAETYAAGIQVPYWQGKTKVLPLPAMPAQGTQCLNNCRCKWRIVVVDEDAGDYDAYWEWEPTAEHCQTCTERHAQWYPLKIRAGVLED